MCGDQANIFLSKLGESDPGVPPKPYPIRRMTVATLEEYMSERQDWSLLSVVKPTAHRRGQRASESLLCARVNELREGKATLPLIDDVSMSGLVTWLQGKGDTPSVFARFEVEFGTQYREPDGSLVKIDSHMCRRLFVAHNSFSFSAELRMCSIARVRWSTLDASRPRGWTITSAR